MTGTPFRSDGQPIELMQYVLRDGQHIAEPDYQYCYRQAVTDDVCRPITCRWIEGTVTMTHETMGLYRKDIRAVQGWEMREAMRCFFDPGGEVMENLVRQVHIDLTRLREKEGYKTAGALFVCRPSKHSDDAGAEKHVREMG